MRNIHPKLSLLRTIPPMLVVLCWGFLCFANPCNSSGSLAQRFSSIAPQLTTYLQENSIWTPSLDLNKKRSELSASLRFSSPEEIARVRELHLFLDIVSGREFESSADLATEKIFANLQLSTEDGKTNYPIFVLLLRYILENSSHGLCVDRAKVESIYNIWKRKYIEKSLALIRSAGIPQYESILDSFEQRWRSGDLEVIDLSSKKREEVSSKLPPAYRHYISLKEMKSGGSFLDYRVKGFYYGKEKLFALDLAKDPHETLYVFAHEIIHAGSKHFDASIAKINSMRGEVLEIIYRWVGHGEMTKGWAEILLEQVLFSTLGEDAGELFQFHIQKKQEKFRRTGGKFPEDVKPTQEELAKISEFASAVVEVSLEDEFEAYALSTAAYHKLVKNINLRNNDYSESYIKKLFEGDRSFAESIFLTKSISPFDKIRKMVRDKIKEEPANLSAQSEIVKVYFSAVKTLNLFEEIYLEEVKKSVQRLGEKNTYSSILQQDKRLNEDLSSNLSNISDFKKNNKENKRDPSAQYQNVDRNMSELLRDDISNPFAYIGSRLTASRVLLFRENLDLVSRILNQSIATLVNLSAGIMDMHDLSLGELKLVGLSMQGESFSELKLGLHMDARRDVDQIPDYFLLFFDLSSNQQELHAAFGNKHYQAQNELMLDLIKIRLLKSFHWLDSSLPIYGNNLLGMSRYYQKLTNRVYVEDSFSEQELTNMREHLKGSLSVAFSNSEKLNQFEYALYQLDYVYDLARDAGFGKIANAIADRRKSFETLYGDLGLKYNTDFSGAKKFLREKRRDLLQSLSPHKNHCNEKYYAHFQKWIEVQNFYEKFVVRFYCIQGESYAVRPLGDLLVAPVIERVNQRSKTGNQYVPHLRLDFGARKKPMVPLQYEESQF